MTDGEDGGSDQSEVTHYKHLCGACGAVVWVPVGSLGSQSDHSERLFCGCTDQGNRMTRMHGQEGEVTL